MSSLESALTSARHLHPVEHRLNFSRRFTKPGTHPFDEITWTKRDIEIGSFKMPEVEAPDFWSDQSVGIVAKLYFATVGGERESSVADVIRRVVGKIVHEMNQHGYFGTESIIGTGEVLASQEIFSDELTYLLAHQYVTFNTPVWLNLGVSGRDPYCAACYLLAVDDHMLGHESITHWWEKEATIFKSGAGAGANLSNLRGSMEPLSTGGMASGPVAYMRPADTGAGTLKSGGAHRRAAKFVRLDDDHPDIMDFIGLKAREDDRMRALIGAGFDLDPTTMEGEKLIAECTTAQNANISVGIHDEFMHLATKWESVGLPKLPKAAQSPDWDLTARTTGEVVETVNASGMLDAIAEAAWKCGDPGVQFHDVINRWHTTPSLGPITTSNPCGETLLNDNSSCNLAHLNVARFLDDEGRLELDDFCYATDVLVTAMDAICSFSKLPTPEIRDNTRDLRQLGLGYSNLGAALMIKGLPYDSDEGRSFAASVTALMTGRAYRRSAELADHLGPFKHWEENKEVMCGVIDRHVQSITPFMTGGVWDRARDEWSIARGIGREVGYRNSQVTLVAPTGTTSFKMGCDTTGVEPAFSLVTYKKLAGGGSMTMVNGSVQKALTRLGYTDTEVGTIMHCVANDGSDLLQLIRPGHHGIFQTAVGENPISPMGHIKMVGAVQPFLSQGVSKTVNLPESATPADIREVYIKAWQLGLKSVALYRDNSKATQVLHTKPKSKNGSKIEFISGQVKTSPPGQSEVNLVMIDEVGPFVSIPERRRMPRQRKAEVVKFEIDGHEGYLTMGMYEDGTLGEIFLNGIGKDGSTLRGMADAFATDFSIALQYGVPLKTLVSKHAHVNFPPSGPTGDPDVPIATSIPDFIARKVAAMFLDADDCEELGVLSSEVKQRMTARLEVDPTYTALMDIPVQSAAPYMNMNAVGATTTAIPRDIGPACKCGGNMQRTGTCWSCPSCGANTGCGG